MSSPLKMPLCRKWQLGACVFCLPTSIEMPVSSVPCSFLVVYGTSCQHVKELEVTRGMEHRACCPVISCVGVRISLFYPDQAIGYLRVQDPKFGPGFSKRGCVRFLLKGIYFQNENGNHGISKIYHNNDNINSNN